MSDRIDSQARAREIAAGLNYDDQRAVRYYVRWHRGVSVTADDVAMLRRLGIWDAAGNPTDLGRAVAAVLAEGTAGK